MKKTMLYYKPPGECIKPLSNFVDGVPNSLDVEYLDVMMQLGKCGNIEEEYVLCFYKGRLFNITYFFDCEPKTLRTGCECIMRVERDLVEKKKEQVKEARRERGSVISHVMQEHPKGCGVACVAMVAGISYHETLLEIGSKGENGMSTADMYAALHKVGVSYIPYGQAFLPCDRYFIATVPSLNNQYGLHYIVIDTFTDIIFDPNEGVADKKIVSRPDQLGNRSSLIEVSLSGSIF